VSHPSHPKGTQSGFPPGGQLMQGPMGGFGPMISPTMGQPPAGGTWAPRFGQPGNLFGQNPMQRPSLPNLPPNPSPFPGPDPGFPPGGGDDGGGGGGGKPLSAPPNAFPPEPHTTGSPAAAAMNGTQAPFVTNSGGNGGTPEGNNVPPAVVVVVVVAGAAAPPRPPSPGKAWCTPAGPCRSEVNDDQDAILCEASCQKWFHRECTGMTENAYGLLTTEASAVWACDFCLKTKEIQSVYIREGHWASL
uniref:Pygopus family PHD finger 2 n=1 Tax=Anolis carolinensis TaxID=28377 RepID=H9GMN5_ANOCA